MENHFIDNARSKMPALYHLNDIEALKSLGDYRDVKCQLEARAGISFRVNSWGQLLWSVKNLSASVNKNADQLTALLANDGSLRKLGSFSEAKKSVSELLSISIKARSWTQLHNSLKMVILAFSYREMTDKAAIFERNKMRNFVSSSRLEGVHIVGDISSLKMADVLNKYRVK